LTPERISELLQPYIGLPVEPVEGAPVTAPDWSRVCSQLAVYLELILKWNARTNLTAIRSPDEIVRRHFGESLFVGTRLGRCGTLLDFGSGAGFPGIPIQLMRPDVRVTLAESQGKKASFLREAVRTLVLPTEVWAARVETMPAERRFDAVALRAVDDMESAVLGAGVRARERVLILGTGAQPRWAGLTEGFRYAEPVSLPESKDGVLWIARRR
jgi:16S rRNA (guanine527-N7)-methyltransferase